MTRALTEEQFEKMLGVTKPQHWTVSSHAKTSRKSSVNIAELARIQETVLLAMEWRETLSETLYPNLEAIRDLLSQSQSFGVQELAATGPLKQLSIKLHEIEGRVKDTEEKCAEAVCLAGKTIFIQNLRNTQYRLKQAIPIYIELVEDAAIASYYDIDMYGEGDDEQSAIDDLCGAIIEYYESLLEDPDILGPMPKQELEFLRNLIEKTDANKKG